MKWKIKDIEEKINKKIRLNTLSIGFDVAEYNTGIYILKTDNKYIHEIKGLNIIIPKNVKHTINDRLEMFDKEITKFSKKLKSKLYKIAIIEDCHLQYYYNVKTKKKMPQVWVLKILARFETLVWKALKNKVDYKFFKQAYHARLKIGFKKDKSKSKKVKEQVSKHIEKIFDLKIEEGNQVDAFVLALCALLKS